MAESDKTIIMPDNQNNMVPAWLAYGNNNGWNNGLFGGGFGSSFFGALLGALVPGVFGGWGGNGFGWGNGGGNIGTQLNNDNNTDVLLQAINGTDADIRLLATTLNTDVDSIKLGINTIQGAIAQVGSQVGMSGLQVINAIQNGNSALASQLCQCCCEMRQLTVEQGYQNQIRTLEQTNALAGQADRNTASIRADIQAQTTLINDQFCALKERELQSKIDTQADIITQLRGQIDNANQTAAITGYVNSLVSPLQAKVDQIASRQLPTVPVVYPNIQAVNNTPYGGSYYGGFYGNGLVF
jgi:hypothetical protein